jgi:cysteine-rich repeat protein
MFSLCIFASLAAAGCSDPIHQETVCDGGWVCPSDLACGTPEIRCVPPEWVDGCEGRAELAACSTTDIASGSCRDGICTPVACGDGVLDPGELCDDGNLASADGCRGDCASVERCGDGTLDGYLGEQCDDGNALSHDGCNSRCGNEIATWSKIEHVASPPPMTTAAMAYDTIRSRAVVVIMGNTFEFDGAAWLKIGTVEAPLPRGNGAMAFDSERGVTVLFGGVLGSEFDDTWLWDGRRWSSYHGPKPAPRQGHVMVYDAARRRIVLFGGMDQNGSLQDTWEWDGTTWEQRATALPGVGPYTTQYASAAYDPVRQLTVVYTVDAQTWTWDGSAWTLIASTDTGPTPGVRDGAVLTYVPEVGAMILLGGYTSNTEVWRLTGSTWTLETSALPVGYQSRLAFVDPARGALVTAGQNGTAREMYAAPLTTSLDAFSLVPYTLPMSGRIGSTMVYDTQRERGVLFGGFSVDPGFTFHFQTWELGTSWKHAATGGPTQPMRLIMAYDERRAKTVAFSGNVYEWDGATWTTIVKPEGAAWPTDRVDAAAAYDRARERFVMFGGAIANVYTNEMWTWDGSAWQQITFTDGPGPGVGRRLAYDSRRDVLVLFGGSDPAVWEYDGTSWTRHEPIEGPSARSGAGMTFDPAIGQIVIRGGVDAGSGASLHDTWLWDGVRWIRQQTTGASSSNNVFGPEPGNGLAMAYVASLAGTVVSTMSGTWVLRWESYGPEEVCAAELDNDRDTLAGCADPDCWYTCAPECPPGTSCAL